MIQTVLLGDITTFLARGSAPKYTESDDFYVINQKCIRDWRVSLEQVRFTDIKVKKVSDDRRLRVNDILVNSTGQGTLGRVGQFCGSERPATVDSHITIVRANIDLVDPVFLGYVLKSREKEIELLAEGSTGQTELSRVKLANLPVSLPDFETQKKVTNILGAIDEKIELNRKTNKTLEQMGQALFRHYFIDNPEAEKWEYGVLTNIIDLNPRESIAKDAEVTYLEMKNMPERGMGVKSTERRKFTSGTKFRNGDTLLARITPCLENGKTAFVDFLDDGEVGFGSTEYIVMRPKQDILTEYTYFLARSNVFRAYAIQSMVGTSGRQRVQNDSIAAYEIPIPNDELLDQFHEKIQGIFVQIQNNAQQIQTLTTLRDTLLPLLINGKVKV